MVYLITKNRHGDVILKNVFEQIGDEGITSIKSLILKVTSSYRDSHFTDLNNRSVISLEHECKYFKPNFIKKLEELAIAENFDNLGIFENYLLYLFEEGDKKHIAFKGFESSMRIKRKVPKISWPRNPKMIETVTVHFKSETDISLPIDWDFKYVLDNYDENKNKFYINKLDSINDFLITPLEDIRIKNFKIFETILNKNGYFFKHDINGRNRYEDYIKYLPLCRHPDIEKIILNLDYIISEKQHKILLLLLLADNNKQLYMTKIKHTIALLNHKIWQDEDGNWRVADTTEIISVIQPKEKAVRSSGLTLVASNI